jgi:anti-sigma regulatory factor (Ser/Thr protein kinase)
MSATSTESTAARGDDTLVHTALLYRTPEQLRAATGNFLAQAAAAGEPVLAVLAPPSGELLSDLLHGSPVDLTRLDAADAGRNPSRLIPVVLDWLADHGPRARVISESVWPGRGDPEVAECLRHEALVNVALAAEPVSVLCPFDAEHLDAEVVAGAHMTHPQVLDERGVRVSERYGDPLDLARGETWPQVDPSPPISDLHFEGDLWALRRSLAGDELLAVLAPGRREDLVFAVNEAVSNAVRHGDGTCRARVWRDGDRIVSEIETTTPIEDPLAGRRRPDVTATSGRGLWLINQLCDLVELRSGPRGASVRMHVDVA